jgi:type IV pilus assembly protein PilY1
MKPMLKTLLFLGSFAFISGAIHAEDIDIYAGVGTDASKPNVLFVFDNAANFSASVTGFNCTYSDGGTPTLNGTAAGIQQCALVNALSALPANTINVGLMFYNDNQSFTNCGNGEGGCLKWPLQAMTDAGKTAIINYIKSWAISGSTNVKASTARTGAVMQEAWAYYAGSTGLSTVNYSSIQPTPGCQQNYVIFIGNAVQQAGGPGEGGSADVVGSLSSAGGNTAPITITYPEQALCNTSNPFYSMGTHTASKGLYADEWARFMKEADLYSTIADPQNIITYSIGVLDPAVCQADFPALLTSMASVGGGEYFSSTSYQELVDAIATILNKIQAVNSAFASASLPISVNTQGTFLNQVFIGQFRPDGDGKPRWLGNLKQYQFGVDSTDPNDLQLFLADGDGKRAIAGASAGEATTGFISVEARSFWTTKNTAVLPDSIGGFWVNNKQGFAGGFDSPDGNIVEKGGVSQQIRLENLQTNYTTSPAGPRRLYTCFGTNCADGEALKQMPFATTNGDLTATTLGITNPVHTSSISSISRNSLTGIVTVNLTAAPSPSITDPTTASISGSASGQYDYSLSGTSPSASGSTVTYTLPSETPPTSPSSVSSYSAAKIGGGSVATTSVTLLTRSSNAGRITSTATIPDLTFGGGSTLVVGDTISISSSSGYDGSGYTVTGISGTNVTFNMTDTPSVYGGGGQIWVGASCATTGGAKNCDDIGASNTNAPGVSPLPGLVRGVNTTLSTTSHILMVNFTSGGGGTSISFATGQTAKVQNATSASYNSTTGYAIVATGSSCSVTVIDPTDGSTRLYTGTASTANKIYSVCLDLGSSFSLTPSLTGNGAASGTTTAGRAGPGASKTILSMSRIAATCPTSNLATVTVQTSSAHGLIAGDKVIIGSPTPGTGEAAYNGTFDVVTAAASDTFTFQVSTAPACTDSTSGMQLSYQASAGGITADQLIRWIRGEDNVGDEKSPKNGITVRPSVHGDVVHSRPTVIAYPDAVDSSKTGHIVVFYGAGDGTLRAINGNQPPTNPTDTSRNITAQASPSGTTAVAPGGELWSFVPSEFFSKLQRLYSNDPVVKLYNTNTTLFPDATAKDYFFDGSIGVYQDTTTTPNKAYIYVSARRGGRIIYAIDVSDPGDPKLLWKRGCQSLTDNTTCDTGFSELGQTWSQPKPARVTGYSNPVLIFGAGYDANEDSEPPTGDTMGRGIFILDAFTGDILWRASPSGSATCAATPCLLQVSGMTHAIPSDVTLVDRTGSGGSPDGLIDRLYVGDLGGNVWRVDLEPAAGTAPANWQITKLAAVGGAAGDTTKRKIFFPPDVVLTKNFDAVLFATGDREHPVYSNTASNIINRFYMLKDTNTGSDACPVVGGVKTCATTITDNTSSTADVQPASPDSSNLFKAGQIDANGDPIPYDNTGSGFYITVKNGTEIGEKAVNAPTTIGGRTFFGTNTPIAPDPTICRANLGTARGYSVNVVTGETKFVTFDGGGLPPSPVSGLVSVTDDQGNEKLLPFCIGCGNPDCTGPDCTSPLGGIKPPIPIKAIRSRTYWYREHDK